MTCEKSKQVSAYHDRELDPAARAQFESHLAECDNCRRVLVEFRALSRMIAGAALPPMPDDLPETIESAWLADRRSEQQDRGLRRLAGWLTAAAAMLAVSALVWPSLRSDMEPRTNTWDWDAAAILTPDQPREDRPELVQVAQFMAQDLSLGERR